MPKGLLERVGLHRPELRAWAMYDWANSVFMTTVLQVFPIYFRNVVGANLGAGEASRRFALATSLSIALVALASPILGALADVAGRKKAMLAISAGVGVLATGALGFVGRGDWLSGAVLFVVANVGVVASIVFYNSLLPHVARPEEVDRVSTAGFALGYVSGGLLLALNSLWIQWPERFGIASQESAYRLSFLSAAAWWAVFSLPVLLRVAEPARVALPGEDQATSLLGRAADRLRHTLAAVRQHRDAALLLLAFVIYNDAIVTIIRMATTFGSELGIPPASLIAAILLVQFAGIPFTFLFGQLAGRIGPKRAILIALGGYVGIVLFAFRMKTAFDFFVLAFLVASVMGGAQALSRSLYASMVPQEKSAELFGFFGVFDKFGGVVGAAIVAFTLSATHSIRPALLAMILFFVGGGLLLCRVDVEAGRSAAR